MSNFAGGLRVSNTKQKILKTGSRDLLLNFGTPNYLWMDWCYKPQILQAN